MNNGPLHKKVIVISGVGPGLGQTLALQCAQQGAQLVLGARSGDFIEGIAAQIRAEGGEAVAIPTDVSKSADCANLIAAAEKHFGGLDGLVNSAFRFEAGLFESADLGAWRAAMDVTCFGALALAQAAVPLMRRRGGGSIVNVSTSSTRVFTNGVGGYAIPKAALEMATRILAQELGPDAIRVNATLMGWMDGAPMKKGFAARAKARGVTEDALTAELMHAIPLKRMVSDSECARAVIFFLSDQSSAITGALLNVNGGMFMSA
jgi:NAD(P)-dependent dehydrogenase (short-subunit alcohol dehydrogenase family)